MSIGNLKTQGGKGTNFPFQHNVLKGLQSIIDINQLDNILLDKLLENTNSKSRIAVVERVTDVWENGFTVYSFSVANVGTGNGGCQGVVIKPGEVVNFDGGVLNNFFEARVIQLDGNSTELLLTYIM